MSKWLQFGRAVYKTVIPSPLRAKVEDAPTLNALRSSVRSQQNGDLPYVLLQEKHIANIQVVINRNALLASLPQNAIVAEVGVNRGDFSERILRFANPSKLHLIDIWDSNRYHDGLRSHVEEKFAQQIKDEHIVIHRGYSFDELAKFDDHYFDWVYIDTDHSYATTARELQIAKSKVKRGGMIAGHDYVTGDWKLRNRYGVVEAVNEFCVEHNWEMVRVTIETHRHLSYAIREIGTT